MQNVYTTQLSNHNTPQSAKVSFCSLKLHYINIKWLHLPTMVIGLLEGSDTRKNCIRDFKII